MTIAQYLPKWLRGRFRKPAPQNVTSRSKKDWQVLPTLPKSKRPSVLFQDDQSRAGCRILWLL